MKLQELDARRPTDQVAKTLATHMGNRVSFDTLGESQARSMLTKVRGLLREYKSSVSRHFSERNPDYLKLIMLEQALSHRISEMDAQAIAVDMNDPKTQAMMKKAQSGQTLNPEETKTMAAIAAMKKESVKKKRMVSESEVQQAQVVMAAQDMVDKLQGMLEDVSEMQFKDLPALTDAIKNDTGVEQATQFQADVTAALTTLLAAIQAGKAQVEAAQGVLTGQAPVVPGADAAAMPAGDVMPAADQSAEVDADLSLDANLPAEEPEAETPAASLGRERR
jgi:hypothetical protein